MKLDLKELGTIIFAIIIISLAIAYPAAEVIWIVGIFVLITVSLNIIIKKSVGYFFEADVKTRFWSWYQLWFTRDLHFPKPLPMLWLPLLLSYLSKGMVWWLGILSFDISPRTERVSRRHGLYRFSEMTEWHIALIAASGIGINLILAVIGYFLAGISPALNLELFAKINIWYAVWSIIPIGKLDGTKIFFGSRPLWFTTAIITLLFIAFSFTFVV